MDLTREDLLIPSLYAIRSLGGSTTNAEQLKQVVTSLNISPEDAEEIHSGTRTKLDYELAWARSHLRKIGLIESSQRGVWSLTKAGWVETAKQEPLLPNARIDEAAESFPAVESANWKSNLINKLLSISPTAFEHLAMRLLRESGFVEVHVTSQTADGGIDGTGVARIQGFLSFYVAFQCKRYTGSVGAPDVQAFRGAWIGKADRGLLITTGKFTAPAQKEALRPGAPPVDLVDGDTLADKMRALNLGIETSLVEKITIDKSFFESLEP